MEKYVKELLSKFEDRLNLHGRKKVFEDGYKLSSDFLEQESDPEAFTKEFLIEPILKKFELEKLPERHFRGIRGELRKVDYILNNKKNISFLGEAKTLNSDLFDKGPNGAVNQIKGLFRLAKVKENYQFGIATDGIKWVFIDKNSKVVYQLDLTKDLSKIQEILVGKEEVSSEKVDEEISKKFYVWYNALLHGGKYKDHENKTKSISTKDCFVENILFVSSLEEKEQIAQTVMDRLIFIKFLQSKNIVSYDVLDYLLKLDENILNEKLKQLFFQVLNTKESKRANIDSKFKEIPYLNGGLFVRTEIESRNPDYKIKAHVLREVIKFLDSFKFVHAEDVPNQQILDPEILGYIFERAMTATDRKGTGAYYTPRTITKHISKNTIHPVVINKVNKLLKEKGYKDSELLKEITQVYKLRESTLEEVHDQVILNFKVCDNACGSGAFLLAAADVLLDIYKRIDEELRLKNSEISMRKLILRNNLYGVDINPNAVEIAKLRLWLWLVTAYEPGDVKPLPNIDYNLRVGNSLIGYAGINKFKDQKLTLADWSGDSKSLNLLLKKRDELVSEYKDATGEKAREMKSEIEHIDKTINEVLDINFYQELSHKVKLEREDFQKLKPFHWGFEFYDVFNGDGKKGFDTIIGNPPYVRHEAISYMKVYLKNEYETFMGTADLYTYFIERAIKILNLGGRFGVIVSSQFIRSKYGTNLRKFLKKKTIEEFIYFGDLPVFSGATTYPCIIIIKNEEPNKKHTIKYLKVDSLKFASLEEYISTSSYQVNQKNLPDSEWRFVKKSALSILEKIENQGIPLQKLPKVDIYRGIVTGLNKAFVIDEEKYTYLMKKDQKNDEIIKPFITGKGILRWSVDESKKMFIILTKTGTNIENYPSIKSHLLNYKNELDNVWEVKHNKHPWYELRGCKYYKKFEEPKIVFRGLSVKGEFPYIEEPLYVNAPASIISGASPYLSCILNSRLIWFYIVNKCPLIRGNFRRLYNHQVERIPIAPADKQMVDEINSLANYEISLNKRLNEIGEKKTDERVRIGEEIEKTDEKIDQLVYELYGLNDDEIKIVEGDLVKS
ncbi:Eco57I restriction-modification methylase domain-containing protein [Patescibacteria group bacterium]|nr:Eco57I restriction-modification methylase domain-containing protein [Patescibacteria group bacterium]